VQSTAATPVGFTFGENSISQRYTDLRLGGPFARTGGVIAPVSENQGSQFVCGKMQIGCDLPLEVRSDQSSSTFLK
jgi:hypothetical protein